MFKREWTIFGILSACTVAVTLFSLLYTQPNGNKVEWLTYVVIVAIVATLAYLALLLYLNAKQKFTALLLRESFVAGKQYEWANYKLLIDYDSKRLANTYLSTRPIIPFSDVAGFRIETYRQGARIELPDEQCFVSLVVSIAKEGFESEYQYIPAFEIQLDAEDAIDIKQITAELVEKYPELTDMLALQQDITKIIEINQANGIHYNIRND